MIKEEGEKDGGKKETCHKNLKEKKITNLGLRSLDLEITKKETISSRSLGLKLWEAPKLKEGIKLLILTPNKRILTQNLE